MIGDSRSELIIHYLKIHNIFDSLVKSHVLDKDNYFIVVFIF
ncbi:hypothetical protein ICA_05130 [Bacillus cereus BAG1O-3]|nr:hypothetical protein ICA_05130 [Bacillus cereus BAG1O-3]PFG78988.1 hypothetical protein DL97_2680 [Bacillus sp. YF23]